MEYIQTSAILQKASKSAEELTPCELIGRDSIAFLITKPIGGQGIRKSICNSFYTNGLHVLLFIKSIKSTPSVPGETRPAEPDVSVF